MTTLRYNAKLSEAFAWWLHDVFAHPCTGTIGLIGRLCGSLRLMALAHHAHNASAPSNDSLADYLEASYRAGCNETSRDPRGSMTPDEQLWTLQRYQEKTGDKRFIEPQHAKERLKTLGVTVWERENQCNGEPPPADRGEKRQCEIERAVARRISAATDTGIVGRLLRAKFNHYELRNLEEILRSSEARAAAERKSGVR